LCVLGESGTVNIPFGTYPRWSWATDKGTLSYDFQLADTSANTKFSVYVLDDQQMDALNKGTYDWTDYYREYSKVNVQSAHLDPTEIELSGSNIYLIVKTNSLFTVALKYTLELKVPSPEKIGLLVGIAILIVSLLTCCGIGLCCCFCARCQNNRQSVVCLFRGTPPDTVVQMENVAYAPTPNQETVTYVPTPVPAGNIVYTTAPIHGMGNVVYTTAPLPAGMGSVVYAPTQVPLEVYTDH